VKFNTLKQLKFCERLRHRDDVRVPSSVATVKCQNRTALYTLHY